MTAERREAGHEGDQTFVGDCPHCAPSPVVDRDVLDAVEAEVRAKIIQRIDKTLDAGKVPSVTSIATEVALEAVAPVIVKAERARIREGIEGLRLQSHYLSGVNYSNPSEVQQATLNAVLALLDEEARNG